MTIKTFLQDLKTKVAFTLTSILLVVVGVVVVILLLASREQVSAETILAERFLIGQNVVRLQEDGLVKQTRKLGYLEQKRVMAFYYFSFDGTLDDMFVHFMDRNVFADPDKVMSQDDFQLFGLVDQDIREILGKPAEFQVGEYSAGSKWCTNQHYIWHFINRARNAHSVYIASSDSVFGLFCPLEEEPFESATYSSRWE